jgi:hypothetical protein
MLEPRFLAELAMVAVLAASLVAPPPVWVLAAPLVVIVTPATGHVAAAALAVAGALACVALAVWSIFSRDSQAGLFVSFGVLATATLPAHLECALPSATRKLKLA